MYEFEGQQLSEDQLKEIADLKGYTVEELLEKNPSIKKVETAGKQQPQVTGAPVEKTQAPDTVSSSENGSLVLPEQRAEQINEEDTAFEPQEISIEEKRQLPYKVRNELSSRGLPFTQENIDRATKGEFNEYVDYGGKAWKNISYNLFGPGGISSPGAGPMVASRVQQIATTKLEMLNKAMTVQEEEALKYGGKQIYAPSYMGVSSMAPSRTLDVTEEEVEKRQQQRKTELNKSYQEILKLQAAMVDMPRVTDGSAESISDFAAQLIGSTSDVAVSVVPAIIAGAAAGVAAGPAAGIAASAAVSNADMLSMFVTDYNLEKAKSEYKDLSEEKAIAALINDEKTEFLKPAAAAVPAMALEYAGIRGIGKYIASQKGLTKSIGGLLWAANGEGFTESLQAPIEEFNRDLAANNVKDAGEYAQYFADNFKDTYINAFAGTLVFGSAGKALKYTGRKAVEINNATRIAIDEGKMETKIDEIADLKSKIFQARTNTEREVYEKQLNEKEEELRGLIVNAASIFGEFTQDDFEKINDLEKLKREYIRQVKEINQDKDIFDEAQYQTLLGDLKNSYLEAQARIKGIVSEKREDISKKNIEISDKNQELFNIISDPEASLAKVERAKSQVAVNNMGFVTNLINKKFNPNIDSGLTRDMFESAVYEEYSKLINSYKPETGVPFGAYLQRNLPLRLPRIFEQQTEKLEDGGFVFKEDVTERRDIEAEEVSTPEEASTMAAKSMIKELSIPQDLVSEIEQGVSGVLATKLPPISDPTFVKELSNAFRNKFADIVKEQFGKKTEDYRQYLIDNFDTLFDLIPQEVFNKRLPGMFEAVTDATGKRVREQTAVGKGVFTKSQITPEQFADYFAGPDVYASLKSNRKVKLAEIVAQEIGKDAVAKMILNPEVAARFRQTQELLGQDVPGGFEKSIAMAIKRLDQLVQNLQKFEQGKLFSAPVGLAQFAIKMFAKTLSRLLKSGMPFAKALDAAIKKTADAIGIDSIGEVFRKAVNNNIKSVEDLTESNATKVQNEVASSISDLIEQQLPGIISEFDARLENMSSDQKIEELKLFYAMYLKPLQDTSKKFKVVDFSNSELTQKYIEENIPNIANDPNIKIIGVKGQSLKYEVTIDGKSIKSDLGKSTLSKKSIQQTIKNKNTAAVKKYLYQPFKQTGKSRIQVINEQAKYNARILTKELTRLIESGQTQKALMMLKVQQNYMDSPLKLSNRLLHIESGYDGTGGYTYEHTVTSETTYQALRKEIEAGRTENIRAILDKGVASLISVESDSKISETAYKDSNGPDFNILKDEATERYEIFEIEIEPLDNKVLVVEPTTKKEELVNDHRALRAEKMLEAKSKGAIKAGEQMTKSESSAIQKTRRKRFRGPIAPGADDFYGLIQDFFRKGKLGEQDKQFFEEELITHLNDAYIAMNKNIIQKEQAYNNLRKKHKQTFKTLKEKVMGPFNNDMILRAYMYIKAGATAEKLGLSNEQISDIIQYVNDNKDLLDLAQDLRNLMTDEQYWIVPEDAESFTAGSIKDDIVEILNKKDRAKFFEKFVEAKEAIFTENFMNKVGAIYGKDFKSALEDSLYRMETGKSRSAGVDPQVGAMWNWFRGSVGVTMFFHTRSAILQTISFTNYIDFGNNNVIKAAAAYANVPQFSKDFLYIIKSEYLQQRRGGLSTEINMQDLSDALQQDGRKGTRAIISKLLQAGFSFTQAGDSFAIAYGGAPFFRNQANAYMKQGMSQQQAEDKAFKDLIAKTEEAQQSARPDRLSRQQVSMFGKLFLAFQNVTAQMTRMQVKSAKDLIAGRGNKFEHMSRIGYYFLMQNVMFSFLQNAVFAFMFPDDEEEEKLLKTKTQRVINNSLDSMLRGTGVYGAIIATAKNVVIEFLEQERRPIEGTGRADHMYTMIEIMNISAPIGIKARKIGAMIDSYRYNKGVHERMGVDIDNPAVDIIANGLSVGANLPADRILNKIRNLKAAHDEKTETMHKILLGLGWNTWDLGVSGQREKTAEIKKQIRKEKKIAKYNTSARKAKKF